MPRPADGAAVFEQLMSSPRHRDLDEAFVRRIAAEAASRVRDQRAAVGYAKRKLHQAVGAFATGSPGAAVRGCLRAIGAGVPVREACRGAMGLHASTAERAGVLDAFYEQVGHWCGRPAAVIDLGCGLNPLALPWLATAPGATYWCCDVDRDLIGALPALSEPFGVAVQAQARDLLAPGDLPRADLALMLKTLTTLEQQRTGAAREVLSALDARQVVLSLPRGSLSARRRYSDDPLELVARAASGSGYRLADHAQFGGELLCLVARPTC